MDKNLIGPIQTFYFMRIYSKSGQKCTVPCEVIKLREQRRDVQEGRSLAGDSASIRSRPLFRAAREGPSAGARCRSEGTDNKAHRLVLQPAVLCLRPPRLKKS